jgi:PAS domain-containing protein
VPDVTDDDEHPDRGDDFEGAHFRPEKAEAILRRLASAFFASEALFRALPGVDGGAWRAVRTGTDDAGAATSDAGAALAPAGLLVVDAEGRVCSANAGAERTLWRRAGDLVGQPFVAWHSKERVEHGRERRPGSRRGR